MNRKYGIVKYILISIVFACLLSGCSREKMNEQIAESIGTLGLYENNEPVETPKMKAQKEMRESKNEVESEVTGYLDTAARLAASYDYSGALEEIAKINENYAEDDRVISAKIEYQRKQGQLVSFNDDVPHFSIKSLIVDTEQAFDGDDMSYYFNNWALTTEEFKKILQSLYDNNYILMDIYDMVVEVENEDGTVSFALNMPTVPKGKTPIILSFVEANYYDNTKGYGISSRIVLDENGNVQNEYQTADGETQIGAYDVIPIVDEFVEEHPDFSLRGAKGIVSVTGYEGVFGYGIETEGDTIQAIADRLKETGWRIACHSYSNESMESSLTYDEMVEDLEQWEEKVGSLVGDTELLVYPYGEEVSTGSMKQEYLLEQGYHFFFSLWSTAEFLDVEPDYVRQTRRMLDGYDLYYYKDSMTDFFDADEILDPSRPAFE